MPKPIRLTQHAAKVALERDILVDWVKRTIAEPQWTEPDPQDPTLKRHFCSIPENGGRILRVVCKESPSETLVITVFFDRDARRPA